MNPHHGTVSYNRLPVGNIQHRKVYSYGTRAYVHCDSGYELFDIGEDVRSRDNTNICVDDVYNGHYWNWERSLRCRTSNKNNILISFFRAL